MILFYLFFEPAIHTRGIAFAVVISHYIFSALDLYNFPVDQGVGDIFVRGMQDSLEEMCIRDRLSAVSITAISWRCR